MRSDQDLRWWRDGTKIDDVILNIVANLKKQYGDALRDRCQDLLSLYNGTVTGYRDDWLVRDMTHNVTQYCSDTMIAAIMNNQVRPMFLTEAGSMEDQEKANAMQRAVDAAFDEYEIYGELGEQLVSDGVIFGTGFIVPWPDFESLRPVYERAMPWEILASPRDARHGRPRSIYYCTTIDRQVMMEMVIEAKAREAIEKAPTADCRDDGPDEYDDHPDRIRIVRAWHLPSKSVDRSDERQWDLESCSHDGRAAVVVDGHTVSFTAWPYEYLPIVSFSPKRHRYGLYGRGIPEQLAHIQLSITKTMRRIDSILQLYAVPFTYVNRRCQVNLDHMKTNAVGRFVEGNGTAGEAISVVNLPAVPSELVDQLRRQIEFARTTTGQTEMSQVSAAPNVESGIARQLTLDTENIRHTPSFRSWERSHVLLAEMTADLFRVLAEYAKENGKDFSVVFRGNRELETIRWDKVDVGEGKYKVKTYATDFLAKSPTVRMQQIIQLLERGLIESNVALEKLGAPDFDDATREALAAKKAARSKIRRAANGEMVVPTAYDNLELLLKLIKVELDERELYEPDSESTDRVRQLATDTVAQLQKAAQSKMTGAQLQATGAIGSPNQTPIPAAPPPAPAAPA